MHVNGSWIVVHYYCLVDTNTGGESLLHHLLLSPVAILSLTHPHLSLVALYLPSLFLFCFVFLSVWQVWPVYDSTVKIKTVYAASRWSGRQLLLGRMFLYRATRDSKHCHQCEQTTGKQPDCALILRHCTAYRPRRSQTACASKYPCFWDTLNFRREGLAFRKCWISPIWKPTCLSCLSVDTQKWRLRLVFG